VGERQLKNAFSSFEQREDKQAVTFHQFLTDIPLFALSLICRSKRTTNLSLSHKRARGIVQLLHNTANFHLYYANEISFFVFYFPADFYCSSKFILY
ncbi:hypothetical protein, partial [Ursidibacter sp. B-7004-1]